MKSPKEVEIDKMFDNDTEMMFRIISDNYERSMVEQEQKEARRRELLEEKRRQRMEKRQEKLENWKIISTVLILILLIFLSGFFTTSPISH